MSDKLINPKFGEIYTTWVAGEPYPKSTTKPPMCRNKTAVYWVVKNSKNYESLANTWDWQSFIADVVREDKSFPSFDKRDSLKLSLDICPAGNKKGDLKNLIACVEDGLKRSGKIPDDRYIDEYGEMKCYFYNITPGVQIKLSISDIVLDREVFKKLRRLSNKKLEQYYEDRGINGRT
jgi:Holliday junction resolvase RusA-like endonuclease